MNKKKTLLAVVFITMCLCIQLAAAATLQQGSTGQNVRTMQKKLQDWGYYTGSVDGIFGKLTYQAVVWFQQNNGLTADGVVGQATAQALGMSLEQAGGSETSAGNWSQNDVYLLARCIYGEARGEPYEGQVAVAAVVLNRVDSPEFPNSIAAVIYQPLAFTAVADGQINLTPDDTAIRAARDALNGWDPSGGALYYFNPATATSKWIWSRQTVTVIGKHRFAL